MKGYVVIDTEIIDTEAYSEYVGKVLAVIAAHGGLFLVRSSDIEPFEGGWVPKRFVGSAEYGAIDEMRRRTAKSRIVDVEGYDSEG